MFIIRNNFNTEIYSPIVAAWVPRLSTIKLFSINNIVLNDLSVTFLPTEVLALEKASLWISLNIEHMSTSYNNLFSHTDQ